MKVGEKAKVSPQLTGEPDWVEGEVIDIEQNPFKGIVISIKDRLGRNILGRGTVFPASKAVGGRNMFAIAFDMLISDLKRNYGKSYKGIVISIKDRLGRIFWGEEQYFQPVKL